MTNGIAIALADIYQPRQAVAAFTYNITLVLSGSLLIVAGAQISIHLPFTTVPITGQTFAVCLIAALLGGKRGTASVLAYLAQGASGLPVFADGKAGPLVFLGDTAGYLVGFVVAAWIIGSLAQRGWDRHPITTATAMLLGEAVILLLGGLWLIAFYGPVAALTSGIVPFIPGAIVKVAIATAILPIGWKALRTLSSALNE